jgi:ATP-dependent exoDNAse (exonuclease V) alpha subunit
MMRPIITNTTRGRVASSVDTMRLTDLYKHLKQVITSVICLLIGGPGAGKTTALIEMYKLVKDIDLVYAATTNAAAQALQGVTIHSLLGLPFNIEDIPRKTVVQGIVTRLLDYFMSRSKSRVLAVVIDEAFILDAYMLNLICEGFTTANTFLDSQDLGTIKLVLCGDPAQLLAIKGERFYRAKSFEDTLPSFELTGVFRQSSDIPLSNEWVNAIKLYRTKGDPTGVIDWIKELYVTNTYKVLAPKLDFSPSSVLMKAPDSFTIAFSNEMVNGINLQILINHCKLHNVPMHQIYKIPQEGKALYLAKGAPIVVTKNDKHLGVFNRQRGLVLEVEREGTAEHIITRINDREVTFSHEVDTVVPIKLAYAGTIHMSQGGTYKHTQVLLSDQVKTPGAGLVSLTRHQSSISIVGGTLGYLRHLLEGSIDSQALQYV